MVTLFLFAVQSIIAQGTFTIAKVVLKDKIKGG